ncbi:Csu type fimbrial protein [Salinicola rhizosphaerae]|uniref:Spore coat protein U/FanG domain-containing protein n=1 Tax=Salinicola rhizosphaerae TaxID=1443141 RepID=A0ABQ3DU35_9GAMM|nr:spore coat U domain-containing protein [Salinicola rhizosphaerae]GHB13300.1 hypothetical protein GCM10009038_09340 [Salinicola rhizosphaerae]
MAAWLGADELAFAETQRSFQVSATVSEGCLVSETGETSGNVGEFGTLDFGTASSLSSDVLTSAVVQAGAVSLECTPGIELTMRIDGGLNAASGSRQVSRVDGDQALAYALYADAGLQQSIGIDEAVAFQLDPSSSSISLPVYGRLALPGNAYAGTYTDRLTVTLAW